MPKKKQQQELTKLNEMIEHISYELEIDAFDYGTTKYMNEGLYYLKKERDEIKDKLNKDE